MVINIHPADREFIAFNCHLGTFPFGLSSAPIIFTKNNGQYILSKDVEYKTLERFKGHNCNRKTKTTTTGTNVGPANGGLRLKYFSENMYVKDHLKQEVT